MVAIIKFHNFCKIIDETDEELFQALDHELSFKLQGAEFSAAYQGYFNNQGDFVAWDGRRHLMSSGGKFPAGLLPRVQDFFQSRGKDVLIIDERTYSESNELDIAEVLDSLGKTPRPYQVEAAETIIKYDRGVIKLPTGAGKTLVAALIVAKIGKPAIIYVIGKDLLYQFHRFFTDIFQQEIGMIGDGNCVIKDINIATIWSVGQALGLVKEVSIDDFKSREKKTDPSKFRKIKQMLVDSRLHIMDEVHLAACDTVQTISKHIKAEHAYGMSASPWRDDGADLLIESVFGKKIIDVSAKQLIKQGYLVEPIIRFLAPKPYRYKSGKYPKIYSKYIIENEQRNEMIVKGTVSLVEQGFVPLVLFHNIKHGDILYNLLQKKVSIALLSGKDSAKQRDKIKKQLEGGEIQSIAASKIYDLGVDLPILSGLVIAGAGKSSVRALQRIGRVIRPYKGKKYSAVIDFADQAPYLRNHAEARREIYETEFKVTWPQERKKQQS